jgi:hypothetical protein
VEGSLWRVVQPRSRRGESSGEHGSAQQRDWVATPSKNRGHDGNQHNSAGERADALAQEPRSFFSERAPEERPHQEKGGDMDNKEPWKS